MNLFLKGEIMSMAQLKYKRVLLKISGEALAGDKHFGFDFDVVSKVCDVIKKCTDMGVQMGVVIGGGNFWRGVKNGEGYIERTRADHMGMLATAMNCMAVADVLEQKGVDVRVQTALEIKEVAEPYIRARAIRHLEKGRVVLFGCGIGSPFFSTDTAAVLRAAEINADVILLAKNIDGVTTPTPPRMQTRSSTTLSPMRTCWPSTLRSWTPRPRRFRWTTTFPCSSSRSRTRRTSSVRSRARRSAPLLVKTERPRTCGFTIKIFEEVSP